MLGQVPEPEPGQVLGQVPEPEPGQVLGQVPEQVLALALGQERVRRSPSPRREALRFQCLQRPRKPRLPSRMRPQTTSRETQPQNPGTAFGQSERGSSRICSRLISVGSRDARHPARRCKPLAGYARILAHRAWHPPEAADRPGRQNRIGFSNRSCCAGISNPPTSASACADFGRSASALAFGLSSGVLIGSSVRAT